GRIRSSGVRGGNAGALGRGAAAGRSRGGVTRRGKRREEAGALVIPRSWRSWGTRRRSWTTVTTTAAETKGVRTSKQDPTGPLAHGAEAAAAAAAAVEAVRG
ncbi:unnamed protein product, partial [Scytosiphon promiscuus]